VAPIGQQNPPFFVKLSVLGKKNRQKTPIFILPQTPDFLEYGCYNSKLRSGLSNNSTIKYCITPLSNMVDMDQDRQIYRTQQENFKK
jgi:hypothetical protein